MSIRLLSTYISDDGEFIYDRIKWPGFFTIDSVEKIIDLTLIKSDYSLLSINEKQDIRVFINKLKNKRSNSRLIIKTSINTPNIPQLWTTAVDYKFTDVYVYDTDNDNEFNHIFLSFKDVMTSDEDSNILNYLLLFEDQDFTFIAD